MLHVDRGGQVTYHGPGQLVVYPLLDLKRLKIGVRDYVHRIEQAVIDTLAEWNIVAARRDGAPGVYVGDAKVAALGIRVRRGCTFHGLAFNVAMDLEPFRRINPCGYAGLQVTSVQTSAGRPASMRSSRRCWTRCRCAWGWPCGTTPGFRISPRPPDRGKHHCARGGRGRGDAGLQSTQEPPMP